MNKLSDKNPCDICTVDRQIGNPYLWQCECDRCQKPYEWKKECVNRLREYESIGTVEECRAAVEKQRAKKVVKDEYNHDCCPNCGWIVYQEEWGGRYLPHCENCGQAIDWEGDTQ